QLRSQLAALDADGHFLGQELVSHGARSRRSALQSQLAAAEAEAATENQEAFNPAQRGDLAVEGKVELPGIGTTGNDPIPPRDFTAAIQDDLQLGVHPELVKSFHATGKSPDPMGHISGQYWLDLFNNDPQMQAKFAAGDREVQRRFRTACMCVAGKHPNIDPA